MRLTSIIRYSLYNIVKRRPVIPNATYLPLYKSRVFKGKINHQEGETLQLNQNISQSSQRYKEFFPYLMLARTDIFKPKILVTQLQFSPELETLRVTSLRPRGIISQQFHIDQIVPITYADMRAYNKLPEPQLPPYIDETMTYLNTFNHDTYLFQFDGTWNSETVEHPKLSLNERLRQKEWFDRRSAY